METVYTAALVMNMTALIATAFVTFATGFQLYSAVFWPLDMWIRMSLTVLAVSVVCLVWSAVTILGDPDDCRDIKHAIKKRTPIIFTTALSIWMKIMCSNITNWPISVNSDDVIQRHGFLSALFLTHAAASVISTLWIVASFEAPRRFPPQFDHLTIYDATVPRYRVCDTVIRALHVNEHRD